MTSAAQERFAELGGFHTLLGVPMLAEDRVLGVIVLWRKTISPFDERTIALVDTFATRAAIAIRNVTTARALEVASGHTASATCSWGLFAELTEGWNLKGTVPFIFNPPAESRPGAPREPKGDCPL